MIEKSDERPFAYFCHSGPNESSAFWFLESSFDQIEWKISIMVFNLF